MPFLQPLVTESDFTAVHDVQVLPRSRDLRYSNLVIASPFANAAPIFIVAWPLAVDLAETDRGAPGLAAGIT